MIHTVFVDMKDGKVLDERFLEHVPREREMVQLSLAEHTYAVAKIMNILTDSQQACGVYLTRVKGAYETFGGGD